MSHVNWTLSRVLKNMCGTYCDRHLYHLTHRGDDGNLVIFNKEYVKDNVMDLSTLSLDKVQTRMDFFEPPPPISEPSIRRSRRLIQK